MFIPKMSIESFVGNEVCSDFPRIKAWCLLSLANIPFCRYHRFPVSTALRMRSSSATGSLSDEYIWWSSASAFNLTSPQNKKMSFMKILKNMGPRTLPWGTPRLACSHSEKVSPILTVCVHHHNTLRVSIINWLGYVDTSWGICGAFFCFVLFSFLYQKVIVNAVFLEHQITKGSYQPISPRHRHLPVSVKVSLLSWKQTCTLKTLCVKYWPAKRFAVWRYPGLPQIFT